MKNPAAPQSTESGSASLKTMTSNRRSRSYVSRRVERKAPWEPRRVEGDGHVIATCGFTRPRSFTEDNAFHQLIVTRYGRGGGVGRGLGGGLDLGVGVGRGVKLGAGEGVAVGVTVAVGVAVAVTVAVAVSVGVALAAAVAVAVGVKVAVAVGVGLGVPAGPVVQPPAAGPPSPLQKY